MTQDQPADMRRALMTAKDCLEKHWGNAPARKVAVLIIDAALATPKSSEGELLDIMCEASCDAFMSQIVVDGNGGLEFLPEALDAALKAAAKATGKPS